MDSLINLDSPIARNKIKSNYTTDSPLIPGPCNSIRDETPNNPFDEVIRAVEFNQQPDDPFEVVLQEALGQTENKNSKTEDRNEVRSIDTGNKNNNASLSCSDEKDVEDLKNEIREFVSERIFQYVKKTLNSSLSQTDLTNSKKSSNKCFLRSYSAGLLRHSFVDNSEEDSGCSNCGHKLNTSLPLDSNSNSDTYPRKVLNTTGNMFLKSDDPKKSSSDDLELTKEKLRKEAEKMRKLIRSELVPNNCDVSQTIDNGEYLEDMTPPWENRDVTLSDEEDSIGLPILKKIRCNSNSMSPVENSCVINESALHKYLKKRYSTDLGQSDDSPKADDSIQTVDCFSPEQIAASSSLLEDEIVDKVDKIEIEAPKLKDVIDDKKIETHLINDKTNAETLRPKKKGVSEVLKKGPMKAVLPLQKMSKNLSAKITSPFKSKTTRTSKIIKKDEKKTENINPVAASTPTKSSPDSDVSISSLRGRENNKMSPTGRKAAKRSQSTSKVEHSKTLSEQPRSISSSEVSSASRRDNTANKDGVTQSKTVMRPHSAPDGSEKRRSALKALVPSPIRKTMHSPDLKNSLRAKEPIKSSTKDKENQAKLKKK